MDYSGIGVRGDRRVAAQLPQELDTSFLVVVNHPVTRTTSEGCPTFGQGDVGRRGYFVGYAKLLLTTSIEQNSSKRIQNSKLDIKE
jgi:hypothetical protein